MKYVPKKPKLNQCQIKNNETMKQKTLIVAFVVHLNGKFNYIILVNFCAVYIELKILFESFEQW